MEVSEFTIQTEKTARYCTWGNSITKARHIWFACHGYGMLARFFIRKFHALDPDNDYVVVPEALQRFYLEGFSGKVGATWMTREARLDDIHDYVHFLDKLHAHLGLDKLQEGQSLIHFGFSQGVATMARYIAMGKYKPHKVIFWAGTFPPDLEPVQAANAFAGLPVYTALGHSDPFAGVEQKRNNDRHFEAMGIAPIHLPFQGGHDITVEALLDMKNALSK